MVEKIKAILWAITTGLMLFYGIYFSFKLKFPQLRIIRIIKSLKNNKIKGLSPLNTLSLTLAGRVGVGSIAGVALAIYIGGPGTVFWMWVVAIVSGSLAYAETLLAVKYKIKIKEDEYEGGPSYYIKQGLNNKILAYIYSCIIIFAYLAGFIPIQTNTITKSFDTFFNVNHIIIGIPITIISLIIIFGGIKKISKVTSKLVPFMTMLYIFLALLTVILNYQLLPEILKKIIFSAFDLTPFLTGFMVTLLIGVQRGIFSNESGIGIGSIAASASNSLNASKSGYVQVLGVYITTIIICTSTAFMVLTSDFDLTIDKPNGIEITSYAFLKHFNSLGNLLLVICILLFSFSTILTGYYYCESNLNFIKKNINKMPLKLLTAISVFLGTIISPTTIWQIIDILVAILAIINIYVLYKLKTEIKQYHEKYGKI